MIENLFNLKGKVALVTGGSKGIGAMITRGLIESGVKVYISSRSEESCSAYAAEMNKIGECVALPTDLMSTANIEELAKELSNREKQLDILISSIAGFVHGGLPTVSYNTSKAAVNHLTRILAKELAPKKITVNAIAPGFFPSKMTAHFDMEKNAEMAPLKRVGQPTDVAGLTIFLCAQSGSFMTGNIIPLDGGMLIQI